MKFGRVHDVYSAACRRSPRKLAVAKHLCVVIMIIVIFLIEIVDRFIRHGYFVI